MRRTVTLLLQRAGRRASLHGAEAGLELDSLAAPHPCSSPAPGTAVHRAFPGCPCPPPLTSPSLICPPFRRYAAEGYARAKGLAALVTTFSVGGLSVSDLCAALFPKSMLCMHLGCL